MNITPIEARQEIEQIARGHGWLSQTAREESHEEALIVIENLRQLAGSSARTLVTNLYGSQAHFLFELVQNAEDNSYLRTHESPFITFDVYPNEIIVRSNEDGFNIDNVKAICSIGESTKRGQQGYIGEKGIGFKSVFMVASEVHIQSGPFSFYLQHRRGDNGMGMITPEWEDPEEILPEPLTQMRLLLSDTVDRASLDQQFHELPETILLFLSHLKQLHINKYSHGVEPIDCATYSCAYNESNRLTTLTKTSEVNGEVHERETRFYIPRRELRELPWHEQRENTTAEVVLAFPVDSQSNPQIQRQLVYAYLPMRDFGFTFLIQSDFVTQASRQDAMDTPRNVAILDGVAEAFRDAVLLQFSEHPTLQYTWIRYLPKDIPQSLWAQLQPKIKRALAATPCLRSQGGRELKRISEVFTLTRDFRDRDGNPLFADSGEGLFLALEYHHLNEHSFTILRDLGVRNIDWNIIIHKLCMDVNSPASKLKAPGTDEDWHSRLSTLLCRAAAIEVYKTALRHIPFIPLQDGTYVSADIGEINFPESDGIRIPTDLGLRLVHFAAYENAARKTLFEKLGIGQVPLLEVTNRVFAKHNTVDTRAISKVASVAHLRYLYHVRNICPTNGRNLWVFDISNSTMSTRADIYLDSNDRFGTRELLAPHPAPISAPGMNASFLNHDYTSSGNIDEQRAQRSSWLTWLHNQVGIKREPRLTDERSPSQLSPIFRYLAEYRPDMFIGTLAAHWSSYEPLCLGSLELLAEISQVRVRCRGELNLPLHTTFWPSPALEHCCGQYLVSGEEFPFLEVERPNTIRPNWDFLDRFGVTFSENLRFYLNILQSIKRPSGGNAEVEDPDRILDLYEAIQNQLVMAPPRVRETLLNGIRQAFNEGIICNPFAQSRVNSWVTPAECLWEAPQYLTTMVVLSTIAYNDPTLAPFFTRTLEVQNVSFNHLVGELESRKNFQVEDHEIISDIYKRLGDIQVLLCTSSYICALGLERKWFEPSLCLWADTTPISGKVAIRSDYFDLENFFVGFLGVRLPDIGMLVGELRTLAQARPSTDAVKNLIWNINSMNPTGRVLNELLDTAIFPVHMTDGQVRLQNVSFEFFIIDRQWLAQAFAGQVHVLDFSLEEVRRLQPFLSCLRLDTRYLSKAVREVSAFEGDQERPSERLTAKFRRLAAAIFRCAVHYGSPRAVGNDRTFYDALRRAEVLETDRISSKQVLTQHNQTFTVEVSISKLLIRENEDGLRIYVPRDPREQELCYLRLLPERLFSDLIMREPAEVRAESVVPIDPNAITVMTSVLTGSSFILEDILEDAGILEIQNLEEAVDQIEISNALRSGVQSRSSLRSGTMTVTNDRSPPGANSIIQSLDQITVDSAPFQRELGYPLRSSGTNLQPEINHLSINTADSSVDSSQPIRNLEFQVSPQFPVVSSEYSRLLDTVITAAMNKDGQFPSRGIFNMDPLRNALARNEAPDYIEPFGIRADNLFLHDTKIGAAGELYVFEILTRLERALPNFGIGNWQSTIRRHVREHPSYYNIEEWRGTETADLAYHDTEGYFTRLLINNGYPLSLDLEHRQPKYFLEVKTTTSTCDTRFFMSRSQYQRMQRMTSTRLNNVNPEIYIIFRVFNLGRTDMDMKIYLDPEALRLTNELEFTVESYSVRPGMGVVLP